MAIEMRRASLIDLDLLLANVQEGFDSYIAFAPLGWQPPDVSADRERTAELLSDSATWALTAFTDGQPAGHVAFFPAHEPTPAHAAGGPRSQPAIPGLAHLWQLFVRPSWWGRGVAQLLHEAALAEMSRQRYRRARLYTPALHIRARRFYERCGWSATAEMWNDNLALMLTEYGRNIG